jgi:hypothetical protein
MPVLKSTHAKGRPAASDGRIVAPTLTTASIATAPAVDEAPSHQRGTQSAACVTVTGDLERRLEPINERLLSAPLIDALRAENEAQGRLRALQRWQAESDAHVAALLNAEHLDRDALLAAGNARRTWRELVGDVTVAHLPDALVDNAIRRADQLLRQTAANGRFRAPHYLAEREVWQSLPASQMAELPLVTSPDDLAIVEQYRTLCERIEQWSAHVQTVQGSARTTDLVTYLGAMSDYARQGDELAREVNEGMEAVEQADSTRSRSGLTWSHPDRPVPAPQSFDLNLRPAP